MNSPNDFLIKDGVLNKYTGTEPDVIIPDGVREISVRAFYRCAAVVSIIIPDSSIKFSRHCFDLCINLESLYIKDRVLDEQTVFGSARRHALLGFIKYYEKDKPSDKIINSYVNYIKSEIFGEIGLEFIMKHHEIIRFAVNYSALTTAAANAILALLHENISPEAHAMLIEYISTRDDTDRLLSFDRVPLEEILKEWKLTKRPDGTVRLTKYIGSKSTVICPATVETAPVSEIGPSAFCQLLDSKKTTASVIIQNGISKIFNGAFHFCRLNEITIPASVSYIGETAFAFCNDLTKVNISPDNPYYVFYDRAIYNKNKTELITCLDSAEGAFTVPAGVTAIGKSAFSFCNCITSVTVGAGLKHIGESAFSNCVKLKSIDIPAGVTIIESSTFNECISLEAADIPEGVTEIGYAAFCHCKSFTSITLPDSVKYIRSKAFANCTRLKTVSLNKKAVISPDAFEGCLNVKFIMR